MIASNNPIESIPIRQTSRIFLNALFISPAAILKNSLVITNPLSAIIDLNFSLNRIFATFSATILTGTVTVTSGSNIVTGVGTDFLNELVVGDIVTIEGEQLEVESITSATEFITTLPFQGTTQSAALAFKSARPTQKIGLIMTINSTDVSSKLVNELTVDWPDEAGGTLRVSLVDSNPFASGAVVNIDELVEVKATFTDEANETFTVRIFKGRIVQFDYDPDNDITSLDVQDLSRDISKETDKINQEIHGVDPVFVETRTAPRDNFLTTSKKMDPDTDNPIFGIWNEDDTEKKNNLAEQVDFTLGTDFKSIIFVQAGTIISGRNYTIRYALASSEFVRPTTTKSGIIEQIAQLAGITSLINERAGKIEDEVVAVNIVANQEFPLDIMRKVVLPQTWKIEFSENGDLVIRRERLKATPDFIFNESSIIEQTLTITKSLDKVVNDQCVSGIAKRLGRTEISEFGG